MSLRNRLIFSDGTAIGPDSIVSCSYVESCNSGVDIEPGSACVASLTVTVRSEKVLATGSKFTYYVDDSENGSSTQIGVFNVAQCTKESGHTYSIQAYDNLSKSEVDLSEWLRANQNSFPMSLLSLVKSVCEYAGLSFNAASLVNKSYEVPKFYADGVTARQVLQWAAQIDCAFCVCDLYGTVYFRWYQEKNGTSIAPGFSENRAVVRFSGLIFRTSNQEVYRVGKNGIGFYSDTLIYEDYAVDLIDKVQIKQSDEDVGVIYPESGDGTNALVVQGNLLLLSQTADKIRPVAEHIYTVMRRFQYVPATMTIPGSFSIRSGDLFTFFDQKGTARKTVVMSCEFSSGSTLLQSTGNVKRSSNTAVNLQQYKNLDGKMLEIRSDIDGLEVTASQLSGNYTQLKLTVDGLSSRTEDLAGNYTQVSQKVDGLDLTVVKKGQVRTQFAADADSVDITSGLISFKSNTLAVDSSNFKLNAAGNVTASGSFSSNNGVGGAGRNESTLSSGSIAFRRTTSAGKNLLAVEMYGLGANAAHGCMNIYGTDASNNNNIGQFIVQGSYTGGQVWIRNAAGQNEITLFGGNGGNAGFEGNVDIKGETGLGVSKNISCQSINVWGGGKSRVVPTSFGPLKMAAFETPEPTFADSGSAVCDASGICCLTLHPKFAETISAFQELKWLVTPTAPGSLWVEKQPDGTALVHGGPAQTFDWLCMGAQAGFDAQYAERTEYDPPNDHNPAYGQLDLLEVFEQETQQELDSLLQYPDYIYVEDELLKGELV